MREVGWVIEDHVDGVEESAEGRYMVWHLCYDHEAIKVDVCVWPRRIARGWNVGVWGTSWA